MIDRDGAGLQVRPDSGLGILRRPPEHPFNRLGPKAVRLALAPLSLVLTKANSRSTVHRPAYLDYIGVKRYSPEGEVIGERRFLGLYTTTAYHASLLEIPFLRGKVERVLERAGFPPDQPRPQGADRDPRVLPARLAVPDRQRRAVRDRDGDPRARRAPAGAAVRPPRSARPVRRVPGHDSARPVQHREPRAGRRDPARGVRRQPPRLDAAAVGVGARARALRDPHARRDSRRLRRRRDRVQAGRRDPRVDRRSADGAGDRARRGARAEAGQPLRARVPARLPRRLARPLRGLRHRPDRGARRPATGRS